MTNGNSGLMLVGIGSGGCRLAAAACRCYGDGITAIGFDTDEDVIRDIDDMPCRLIGSARLNRHGAGGVHASGRLAAHDDLPGMLEELRAARIVVIVACLGGGTGGGATPVILEALKAQNKTTLCFVTLPFSFEGSSRRQTADRDRPFIEAVADTLVEVELDDLYRPLESHVLSEATQQAEQIMADGLCLLWRLLQTPGFIRLELDRVLNMLMRAGKARFGHVVVTGETRAASAVKALAGSPLLHQSEAFSTARALMMGILAGPDLRFDEIATLMNGLKDVCRKDVQIEMGVVTDPGFNGRIALVALAFETWVPIDQRMRIACPDSEDLAGSKNATPEDKLRFGKGLFGNVPKTCGRGEDLDIPTFQRKLIRL